MVTRSQANYLTATRSLSARHEPFWVAPDAIKFKISPHHDLGEIKGGNWDLGRRFPLVEAVKHRAIRQRYADGARWEDTDLFKITYARRLASGQSVRGETTMKGLLAQYYRRVDGMHADLKKRGFFPDAGPLPVMLIGRDGEVFIGNQGNHRLAMAQVLGLKQIAGRIICRHRLST